MNNSIFYTVHLYPQYYQNINVFLSKAYDVCELNELILRREKNLMILSNMTSPGIIQLKDIKPIFDTIL